MNKDRLIKLMMMTTSSHDGECLTAIRMANAKLAEENMNWEEVLNGSSTRPEPEPQRQRSRQQETPPWEEDEGQYDWDRGPPPAGSYSDRQEIELLFSIAFGNTSQYSSFYQFLTSVNQWWSRKGFLTRAQYEALKRAARR
jgi:hypothetical protein